jgi:autotransporter passenger strand-loop-strand repeat protein
LTADTPANNFPTLLPGAILKIGPDATIQGGTLSHGITAIILAGATVSGGTLLASNTGEVFGLASNGINSGGKAIVFAGGTDISATIYKGGTETVSAGGLASATTILSGGTLTASAGGTAADAVVSRGGLLLVIGGVSDPATIMSGGELIATLSSAEGATLSGQVVELLAGSALPAQYAQAGPGTAGGGTPIGRVEMVSGLVTVVRNGVATPLNVGDLVLKNDVIETGGDSAAGIGFVDGTEFRLSAHARMVLNEFVYDPNGSANSAFLTADSTIQRIIE